MEAFAPALTRLLELPRSVNGIVKSEALPKVKAALKLCKRPLKIEEHNYAILVRLSAVRASSCFRRKRSAVSSSRSHSRPPKAATAVLFRR